MITRDLFQFLVELEANNNREWFQANKSRYESDVRNPALALIAELAEPMAAVFPSFPTQPGGRSSALMRPYRDTRFAKDKTPYKTNVGIHFRHVGGADVHAPGLYLHLSPSESFLGAGIWMPAAEPLLLIRKRIEAAPGSWAEVKQALANSGWSFGGESLSRPPKGFDKNHIHIEDLRRKDFILARNLSLAEVTADNLAQRLASDWAQTVPLMRFLCEALAVSF